MVTMKTKLDFVFVYVLVSILSWNISEGKFILGNYNEQQLSSEQFNYPHHVEELDVIWRFSHSVHLQINEFQLDGQTGDFVLISDLPLTFEESFEEYNNTNQPPPFLAESIVTSQGLLLSWQLQKDATFKVLSKHGTFIYFHAEDSGTRSTFPFKGFNITVEDLDVMRLPTTTSTTEGTRAPPDPTVEIYTSKFLKNEPYEFYRNKEQFKTDLAAIASQYCKAEPSCATFFQSNFNSSEVNIPTDSGLRMCDVAWEVYSTCVEVTFAITREEGEDIGGYLMPKWRLDDMWTKKKDAFESRGYFPMEPPPSQVNLNTWVWMASILGILLFLMIPMCLFWVINEQDHVSLVGGGQREELEKKEAEEAAGESKWKDVYNPIRPIIAKLKRQNEDSKYYNGVGHGENNASEYEDPSRVTKNILFQEQDVGFEYDNEAFGHGDEEHDDEEILYGHEGRTRESFDFMNVEDEPFPPQNTFLRIQRQFDGGSDTEI